MRDRSVVLVLAFILGGGGAAAHDTWLQGPKLPLDSGSSVLFELTSGGAFPSPEHAIERGRIERDGIRVAGLTRRLEPAGRRGEALRLRAPVAVEGVAVAFVSLKPRSLELKAGQVEEYLAEIGEKERLWPEWQAGRKRWRESYRKHAKAYLRVGDAPGPPGAWGDPVGLSLEIVPERDPSLLQPGDVLPVVVLLAGRPLAGFALASTDGRERRFQRTDADGRASVQVAGPGRWLLAGTHLRSAGGELDWQSEFTTVTFQVAPR